MAEQILSYALTTLERVKNRLTIVGAGNDTVLIRMINSISDFIEGETGRRFKETAFSNEVYGIYNEKQEFLFLKNYPVSSLTSLQYRAGTPSNPSWTNYISDNYELLEDGKTGMVKIYGGITKGVNKIRASYTAGYKTDWANFGDITKHTLPADLTDLSERLVVRIWKRRETEGKASEGAQGDNITWKDELGVEDKMILERYKRIIL